MNGLIQFLHEFYRSQQRDHRIGSLPESEEPEDGGEPAEKQLDRDFAVSVVREATRATGGNSRT
jgi:hypothetical protein